jgi:hypothetical protein
LPIVTFNKYKFKSKSNIYESIPSEFELTKGHLKTGRREGANTRQKPGTRLPKLVVLPVMINKVKLRGVLYRTPPEKRKKKCKLTSNPDVSFSRIIPSDKKVK